MSKRLKSAKLTEGPIGTHLFALAYPMFFGLFAIISFNLADTYFISRLGTLELAAISYTFPVVSAIGSLALGIGAGATSVISRAIGEGDPLKVQRLATDSLLLACLVVGIFVLVGYLTITPLFRALGATDATLPLIREYMEIWYLGMAFVIIPMVGNGTIRATGDSRFPALIMIFAAVVNVLLDPIFIFGYFGVPAMGIKGAAIATLLARALTLCASLAILHFREHLLTFYLCSLKGLIHSWKSVLHVGIPAGANNMIVPFSIGIVTRLVAEHGKEAVAGFGVATRVESLAMIVIMAIGSGIGPLVGQNFGAQLYDRVRKTLKTAYRFCLIWGVTIAIFLAALAQPLVTLFDSNASVIDVGKLYLYLVPISFGMEGILMVSCSSFTAIGKPLPSSTLTILRMFLLYVPLAWIGNHLFGVMGIFMAGSLSNLVAGFFAYRWATRTCFTPIASSKLLSEIEQNASATLSEDTQRKQMD